jgi:hypothetical protein
VLASGHTPLSRRRRRDAVVALATALGWAVLLPAAHTLGHRDDHEHTPSGLIHHGLGEDHHHPAAGPADESHDEHADDDDDHDDADARGLDQLSRRHPPAPHGHGSLLHLGATLLGHSAFVFTAELEPAPPAAVVLPVSAPRRSRSRPCDARAPPVTRTSDA